MASMCWEFRCLEWRVVPACEKSQIPQGPTVEWSSGVIILWNGASGLNGPSVQFKHWTRDDTLEPTASRFQEKIRSGSIWTFFSNTDYVSKYDISWSFSFLLGDSCFRSFYSYDSKSQTHENRILLFFFIKNFSKKCNIITFFQKSSFM